MTRYIHRNCLVVWEWIYIYIYKYIYIYNATVYPPTVLLNENEYIMPLWYPPHHFSSMGVNIYGHDISTPCIVVWEWIFNATPSYSIPNLVSYIVTLYFNSRPNLVWGWLYRYIIFWLHKICFGDYYIVTLSFHYPKIRCELIISCRVKSFIIYIFTPWNL